MFGNGYSWRRSITIDHTKVPNSNQANFPVAVIGTYSYLAHTTHSGLVTDLNGYDIAFYSDAAGTTALSWEIESYNHETGAVVFWVKVPSVLYTTDTVIYMFYGNSSVSSFQSTATSSWNANYKQVLHLGNATTLSVTDSTSNNNTPSTQAGTAGVAKIGGGAVNAKLTSPKNAATEPAAIAIEFWASGMDNQSAYNYIVDENADSTGITIQFAPSNGGYYITVYNLVFNAYSSHSFSSGFHHFVLTVDGTNVKTYIDGVLDLSIAATGAITWDATKSIHIGSRWEVGLAYVGTIDEYRLSNVARSADWIAAEYANQNSPSTFYSIGAETIFISGTAAVTASRPVVAVSGSYAPYLRTGTAAVTAAKASEAISGTYTSLLKTGTAEVAAGQPTVEVAGTYTSPLKTGTVAVEAAKPTIDASGTFEQPVGGAVIAAKPTIAASGVFIPLVTGTAVVVAAQAAAAIAATRTSPDKTGTIGVTASPATIALSGTYAPPLKTGTVAVTAAKSAVAVTGTYASPLKTGTSAVAAAKATTAASGDFIPLKTGTGVVAARNAVVALAGIVARPIITGTVAVAAARAAVAIYGDLIVLPPPSLSGFRVGAWFRPA